VEDFEKVFIGNFTYISKNCIQCKIFHRLDTFVILSREKSLKNKDNSKLFTVEICNRW
jgi:hypothetical protein